MRDAYGSAPWILAWTIAAGLALLLFGVMSLVVLRNVGPGTPAASLTPAPPVTPALSASGAENVTPPPQAATAADGEEDAGRPDATAMAGLWLSAISAITALLGLVSSLWLGWRKEKREVAQHLLELERTRLEVERLRRDLGKPAGAPSPGRSEDAR
jgi:hypothetical protein